MRENKFRLWDSKNKEMARYVNCSICIDGSGVQSFDENGKIEGTTYNKDLIPLQYTGIKDKNGTEIYEGDIVSSKIEDKFCLNGDGYFHWKDAPIVFDEGAFKLNNTPLCGYAPQVEFEVVGNIYNKDAN